MRVLTVTDEGRAHVAEFLEPVLGPGDRALGWRTESDAELERFLDGLVLVKEAAARATPEPRAEGSGDDYSPALLM
jgi:hypothetical protein